MKPVKDQMSADFEKAKSAGSVRVGRIRQIFQEALSQTVSELKQGASEFGSIAKESTSTLTENLKSTQKSTPQEVIPVQVEIHDDVDVANLITELPEPVAETPIEQPLSASQTVVVIEAPATQQESTTPEALAASLKALIEQMVRSFKSGETYATLQQQFANLREKMATLDDKLSNRYGNRYEKVKQDFSQDVENTKAWYERMKAEANASGVNVLEHKQAEITVKMSEAGATIAQQEAKIKQLLKELWRTKTKL